MKRALTIVIFLLAFFSLKAQETKAYQFTFEDCMRFAVANSNERKSMELSHQSLETTYGQSKQLRLPNLSASFGENLSLIHI